MSRQGYSHLPKVVDQGKGKEVRLGLLGGSRGSPEGRGGECVGFGSKVWGGILKGGASLGRGKVGRKGKKKGDFGRRGT